MNEQGTGEIRKLRVALVGTILILAGEAIGGWLSHSLALLTDAAHMLTDVGAAALALWASSIALRRGDEHRTFGYGRAPVLAALANACALFVVVIFLVIEAVKRFQHPQPVAPTLMLAVAAAAVLINLLLSRYMALGGSDSINVRAVIAHVLGDAVVSAMVIIAALAILVWHEPRVDPIASVLAAVAVCYSAWRLVREALNILMEGTPQGISIGSVRAYLKENANINDVHDLHVWSLSDRSIAASLHVRVDAAQLTDSPQTVAAIKTLLRERYKITHATVEVECIDCEAAC